MVVRISSELQAIEGIILLVKLPFQNLISGSVYIDYSIWVTDGNFARSYLKSITSIIDSLPTYLFERNRHISHGESVASYRIEDLVYFL